MPGWCHQLLCLPAPAAVIGPPDAPQKHPSTPRIAPQNAVSPLARGRAPEEVRGNTSSSVGKWVCDMWGWSRDAEATAATYSADSRSIRQFKSGRYQVP
jgi:hypothetical protein